MAGMVDFAAVTARQQQMWATGDFHRIGVSQPIVGERLVRAAGVHAGERVLDVATGAGNTALAAARRWAVVTASDYVPDLLSRAESRAVSEGLSLRTEVADAQDLPYEDATYDVVTSTFGAMFAPDQEATATELLRVLVPGTGRLGMANWTPEGFVGELFALGARHVPPPAGVRPPSRWGTRDGLAELLGDGASEVQVRERTTDFVYPSADFMLEYYRRWFGPTATQFAALDPAGQAELASDLLALYARHNCSGDETVLIRSPYLQVVATKA
jgi:SAM-dependent methyltransferase